ncbi:Cell division control protein 3 [Coemansia sp. RSA 2611]|nr:Cell division control protein 3 [Coemansia sp. RSA 2611]
MYVGSFILDSLGAYFLLLTTLVLCGRWVAYVEDGRTPFPQLLWMVGGLLFVGCVVLESVALPLTFYREAWYRHIGHILHVSSVSATLCGAGIGVLATVWKALVNQGRCIAVEVVCLLSAFALLLVWSSFALAQARLPLGGAVGSEVAWYLLNVLPLGLVLVLWTVVNAPRVFCYEEAVGKQPPVYRLRHSGSYGGHYEYPAEYSYPLRAPGSGAIKKKMNGYVGFSNFPNQEHRRSIKRGFNFTLMVVGESGLGKSTLINTLFESKVYPTKETEVETPARTGVEITSVSADIQENGVRLRLSVVDTPGFGDSINNDEAWRPILENIESRFDAYLAQENRVNRSKIVDNRVNAVLYFIRPSGHGLRAIDIEFMKHLHTRVNLIPVIARADTLAGREVETFKARIMADINFHGIQIFKPVSDQFDDPETVADNKAIASKVPFAVVGSEKLVDREDGTKVRGRRYPWGVIEVENEAHNDFVSLRQMLLRTHMEELRDATDVGLYEAYRTQKLLALGHVQDNGVFREFNPRQQLEEEERLHGAKMGKLEAEMAAVFRQKVQEKEGKLKQSEEELHSRHQQMKSVLEKQRLELEEKRARIGTGMQQQNTSIDVVAAAHPGEPVQRMPSKDKKKRGFF